MERYKKYKGSGIEWIGEIPEHWNILTLKRIAKICNGQDHKTVWDDNGIYPIMGSGGVFGNANDYLFEGPSVLLGRKGTIDKPQFVDKPFWSVDTAYFTIVRYGFHPKLFYYLCNTIDFERYKYGSAVPSMTQELLNTIPFALPNNLFEQTAIADYLDRKTAEIDDLIAKKKRLLELYEEEKTAIINHAVTKGINPDAPMKDSGIEWLGEVPEKWEVKKLSWCFGLIGSGTTPKSGTPEYYHEGNVNWLLTGDLNDGEVYHTTKKITEKALQDHSTLKEYPNDSIVIAMYGATIGKLGILKVPTTVNQACCVLSEPILLNHLFGFYCLKAAKSEIITLAYGGGQPNISQELIKSFRIPFPKVEEQEEIVAYILQQLMIVEGKEQKTKRLIEYLSEYRTALISEVVTGKVKVPE